MSDKLNRESDAGPALARPKAWFSRWTNAIWGLVVFLIALAIAEYIVELEVRDRAALQRVAMFAYMIAGAAGHQAHPRFRREGVDGGCQV